MSKRGGGGDRAWRSFYVPGRAPDARAAIRELQMPREVCERACLVVTELISNAVLHAGGVRDVRIAHGRDVMRIEVADCSQQMPQMGAGGSAMGGRGLRIVSALSSRWGADATPGGKVVWAELKLT